MDVLIVAKRCPEVMKLDMELHHRSLKVMEFIIDLHCGSFGANVEASLHGLL